MNRTIVIGGGAGGLAAAIRLASGGRKVLLLEKEPSLGGYLTSFSRDGFTFDVAMHMVAGGAPGGAFYETLRITRRKVCSGFVGRFVPLLKRGTAPLLAFLR